MTFESLQNLINSGMAWRLEGSVGRACMRAIENGHCMLGKTGHKDYWGNYVPSRTEVAPNTKGDHLFVINHHDEDYACRMASVGDAPMSADTFFSEEEDDE